MDLTPPWYVYSHDQVPTLLQNPISVNIDGTGVDEVFNYVCNDTDNDLILTLNIYGY